MPTTTPFDAATPESSSRKRCRIAAVCARCGDDAPFQCSVCEVEAYCSSECQTTHWAVHKATCQRVINRSRSMLAARRVTHRSGGPIFELLTSCEPTGRRLDL